MSVAVSQQLVAYAPLSARDEILRVAHASAHQLTDKMYLLLKIGFGGPR